MIPSGISVYYILYAGFNIYSIFKPHVTFAISVCVFHYVTVALQGCESDIVSNKVRKRQQVVVALCRSL